MRVSFPAHRPRRLRRTRAIRDAVAETELSPRNLILPVFVSEGRTSEDIPAMPGYRRYPVGEELVRHVEEALGLGINKAILFGVVEESRKGPTGDYAYDPKGPVPRALGLLRETFGDRLVLFADVCLCEYTDHGHCGIVAGGRIDNDATLPLYARTAVTYAEAGADVVAPSGMMDGQVREIRRALDEGGYRDVAIMSYSAKCASAFYGPFRVAAESAPRFGDRRSYQMDPRNAREAVKEVLMDLEEGADMVMVKPALAYLDVIRLVREAVPYAPLAAYNVSGEYSMVKAAAERGWIDGRTAMLEVLFAIRRAGADLILTYHALEAARALADLPF